jgi:hypothetical protein
MPHARPATKNGFHARVGKDLGQARSEFRTFIASKEAEMTIPPKHIAPLSTVRADCSAPAEEVGPGGEKIITRNGESYVALIDAQPLEREHIHPLLIDEAVRGLNVVAAGRVTDARSAIAARRRRVGP